jgi:hypothetical protein
MEGHLVIMPMVVEGRREPLVVMLVVPGMPDILAEAAKAVVVVAQILLEPVASAETEAYLPEAREAAAAEQIPAGLAELVAMAASLLFRGDGRAYFVVRVVEDK